MKRRAIEGDLNFFFGNWLTKLIDYENFGMCSEATSCAVERILLILAENLFYWKHDAKLEISWRSYVF